jgi:ribose 5-phosphate isomerase B
MKIAVGSDEKTHLTDVVVDELKRRGHQVDLFGALLGQPAIWPKVAVEVAERVASGHFDQGVLFCWTGTGISLAANKVRGVRAALCHDPETAKGARKWNDANILAMSLRAVSEQIAKEILDGWFNTPASLEQEDMKCLEYLKKVEEEHFIPRTKTSQSPDA